MFSRPVPAPTLPLIALAQVWLGVVLINPLREPGAPWVYASLAALCNLGGLIIVGYAAGNCLRLWQVRPDEVTWALMLTTTLVAIFSALAATGPMTIGLWRWWTLIPGTFAVYLIVFLARSASARKRSARYASLSS